MYGKVTNRLVKISLGLSVIFGMLISGCTDSRPKTQLTREPTPPVVPNSELIYVKDVKFNNATTVVNQMKVYNNSLFMTGTQFGFTRWEISPSPENPNLTFEIFTRVAVYPLPTPGLTPPSASAWTVQGQAIGALEIIGGLAFMSGAHGVSVANISDTTNPREVARVNPPPAAGQLPVVDPRYVYEAIIHHPSRNMYYGFRKLDYIHTVDTSNFALNVMRSDSYGAPGQTVCCVTGATRFGNRIYVAFTDRVVMFDIGSDGYLVAAGSYTGLQAVNVASTPNYLYIQHEPRANFPNDPPRALYVFDQQGNAVDRVLIPARLVKMAVSWDDGHVYANVDSQSVRIFRIQWAPQQ